MAEGLIGMAETAKQVGVFRRGRPAHPGTITRWCLDGVTLADGKVLKLEHIKLANRLMTTRQALLRFLTAQQDEQDATTDTIPLSPAERQRENVRHERELDALGVA
jgi:hypothetical protein